MNGFVKKRSKSKSGYQWSDVDNGKKKLCWEESNDKVFGRGNTCTFIMTLDQNKKIVYSLNCNFNMKRARVTEKDFVKYVQRMLHQELGIQWYPGTDMFRLKKREKSKGTSSCTCKCKSNRVKIVFACSIILCMLKVI